MPQTCKINQVRIRMVFQGQRFVLSFDLLCNKRCETVFQDTSHSRQASCDALSGSSNAANASVWCAPCRKCIGKFVGAAICASAWFTVYILNQPLGRKNCFFAEWLTHADRYNAFVLSRTFPCKASPHHPRSTPLLCSSCNTSSLHWSTLLPYALSGEPASTWSPAWY